MLCFLNSLLILCSSDQRTALHEAAISGHTAVCHIYDVVCLEDCQMGQLLIDAKADVDARDWFVFFFHIR